MMFYEVPKKSSKKLPWYIWLLLLTMPFEAQGFDIGILINASFVGGLLFVLAYSKRLGLLRQLDTSDFWFISFLGFAALSLFYNQVFTGSFSYNQSGVLRFSFLRGYIHLGRFVCIFFFYKAAKEYIKSCSSEQLHRFFGGLEILALALFIYGTYQAIGVNRNWPLTNLNNIHGVDRQFMATMIANGESAVVRLNTTFGEPKGYGIFLLMLIPLTAGYYTTFKPRINLWRNLLLIGLMSHFVLTFSRASILAAGVGLVALGVIHRIRTCAVILVSMMTCWAVALTVYGQSPVEASLSFFDSYLGECDTGIRKLTIMTNVWNLTMSEPVFGYGLGGLTYQLSEVLAGVQQKATKYGANELAAYIPGGTGWVGTFFFCCFLIDVFYRGVSGLYELRARHSKTSKKAEMLIVFVIVSSISVWIQFMIQGNLNSLYPWLLLGMMQGLVLRRLPIQFHPALTRETDPTTYCTAIQKKAAIVTFRTCG